jgi:hypothetical protein
MAAGKEVLLSRLFFIQSLISKGLRMPLAAYDHE